jgi:hypothetical protein
LKTPCEPFPAASGTGFFRHRALRGLSWDRFLGCLATTGRSILLQSGDPPPVATLLQTVAGSDGSLPKAANSSETFHFLFGARIVPAAPNCPSSGPEKAPLRFVSCRLQGWLVCLGAGTVMRTLIDCCPSRRGGRSWTVAREPGSAREVGTGHHQGAGEGPHPSLLGCGRLAC